MRRILVTGRGGQLATSLAEALPAREFEAQLVGQPEFEFDDPATVAAAFDAAAPEAVVNCAAWTAVDAAEEQDRAAPSAPMCSAPRRSRIARHPASPRSGSHRLCL